YRNAVFAQFTDASAAFRVAQMCETGQDLPQNDEEAVGWDFVAMTAAGGEFRSDAIESLFRLYGAGRGFRKENHLPSVVNSYRLSDVPALLKYIDGQLTSPRVQFYLGEISHRGKIVQRDDVEAAAWLRLASKQGMADAQILLDTLDAGMSAEHKEAVGRRS